MTENPAYLIVYGTLRPDFDNPFAKFLRQRSRCIGEATFPGLLIDLRNSDTAAYPGAVYQPDSTTLVVGTVYDISHQKQLILTHLDDYEGIGDAFDQPDEYVRAVIPVRCNGAMIDCWIYLYNRPIDKRPVITSGDYVRYSRNE